MVEVSAAAGAAPAERSPLPFRSGMNPPLVWISEVRPKGLMAAEYRAGGVLISRGEARPSTASPHVAGGVVGFLPCERPRRNWTIDSRIASTILIFSGHDSDFRALCQRACRSRSSRIVVIREIFLRIVSMRPPSRAFPPERLPSLG
jgi:hypothetical protein